MKRGLLLTCFVLSGTSLSQEPVNPDPTGIFKDSELDVPKEEEKKARETVAQELESDAALPDEVRRVLDRLTVFELVENTVLSKRVGSIRSTLCDQLLELAHAAREGKADGVAVVKYVEDLPPEEPLQPEKIVIGAQPGGDTMIWNDDKGKLWNTLLPNGRIEKITNDGRWKWLNPQRTIFLVDYYGNSIADIVTLKSPGALEASAFSSNGGHWQIRCSSAAAAAVRKPPPYTLGVLAEAAKSEAELRGHAAREIAARRKGVAVWLEEQAKTAPPAAIGKIIDHSRRLTPAASSKWPSRSERIAGTWNVEDGKKLELRLDGTVVVNGQKNKAIWKWAKAKNYTTALVLFGNPDNPSDIWVVRTPSKEPGVLRIATRDSYRKATLN